MEFRSRKDSLIALIIVAVILLTLGIPTFQYLRVGWHSEMWLGLVNLPVVGLLLWLWCDTGYRIDDTYIHYRSGPFRGRIEIASIRQVEPNKTRWVGFRPALARRGIVVNYNKYDEIYFSPDDNDAFVQALLNVRADIAVKIPPR